MSFLKSRVKDLTLTEQPNTTGGVIKINSIQKQIICDILEVASNFTMYLCIRIHNRAPAHISTVPPPDYNREYAHEV